MIPRVRTTILIDDRLGKAARNQARQEGISFSAVVARALESQLVFQTSKSEAPPFRLVTVGGGGPLPGVSLDRTSELLTADDEAAFERAGRKR